MIDPKKQYRTRDGREVRIYAVDGGNGWSVHGAVLGEAGWMATIWNAIGRRSKLDETNDDLIEAKPRIQREVWVNVYPDGVLTKEAANKYTPMAGRIACVKLMIDCEEGEGL